VMAIFTSTLWTKQFETLGSTIGFTPLFLNIFCISLYLGQSMILCPMSPQIWQKYVIGLCILIYWVVTLKTAKKRSSFLLTL
jgi:Flp pilus assembly protein TadB